MPEKLPRRLGRYQLTREVASGGMATVYVGNMLGRAGFARTVAVKVLHPHLASDPSFVAMFFDEARLAARIRHPNVVDVHDVDVVDGELFIVMELIEGVPLSHAIQKAGDEGLPLGLVGRVMVDALAGLHAAHGLRGGGELLGLVHRDVSPQNILVGADGITRIADFGVAKAAGRLVTTGQEGIVKGKVSYLAPEQVASERIDRRVDLFAAGVVLWECLVGRRLFRGDTTAETLGQLLATSIDPPSRQRLSVPIEVDEVCLRALERDRDRRFATAAEFSEALREAVGEAMFASEDVRDYLLEHASSAMVRYEDDADSLPSLQELGGPDALSPERLSAPHVAVEAPDSSSSEAVTPSHVAVSTALGAPRRRAWLRVLTASLLVALGGAAGWLVLSPDDSVVLVVEPMVEGGILTVPTAYPRVATEPSSADRADPVGAAPAGDEPPPPKASSLTAARPPHSGAVPVSPRPPAPAEKKYKPLDGL